MGSESQSEAVSGTAETEGQGGGKDRPPTHCLVGGRRAQHSCVLQLGLGGSETLFKYTGQQGGTARRCPGPAICGGRGAFLDRAAQPGPQPPPPLCYIIHESHIPRGINIQKERCSQLSCSENK